MFIRPSSSGTVAAQRRREAFAPGGECHAEDFLAHHAVAHHRLVPFLENVERKHRVREQGDGQRKQRDAFDAFEAWKRLSHEILD
jgi:hypothetical protein